MNARPRLPLIILLLLCSSPATVHAQHTPTGEPFFETLDIFPFQGQHVHGSTLAVLPNGDVLAAWFQGSGERWADDVAIMGARLRAGAQRWSEPFILADVEGFPDINPVLFVDARERLWLVWYTVLANQWETSLLKYRISEEYLSDGAPVWDWQEVLHVKPGDPSERGIRPDDRFVAAVEAKLRDQKAYLTASGFLDDTSGVARWNRLEQRTLLHARGEDMIRSGRLYRTDGSYTEAQLGYPYFQRMGWQTRNKPLELADGRIILPLYSDGFSFSLMAITDDGGETWKFSEPLVGIGNIQPALAQRSDGTLVAFMRDNGPPPKRLHVSTSSDRGLSWSPVRDSDIPNSGTGADVTVLPNGHWVMVNNDTEEGRHRLAVSVSEDEGRTWAWTRYLELDPAGPSGARSHYPAVVADADGLLHVVYSYHRQGTSGEEKTIRYARFNEAWAKGGMRYE